MSIFRKKSGDEKEVFARYENLKNPKIISIDISDSCNLKCKICKQWKDKNRHKKLNLSDIKKLISQLSKYFPGTILEFSGQEPLLKQNFLFGALDYAKKKNVRTALSTNGILIDEEIAKRLVEMNLHHISLSLDGFEGIHNYIRNSRNSYEKVINALDSLVK